MGTIDGVNGIGTASPVCTINTDRQVWLAEQAQVDAMYNVDEAKRFETMSKAQVRNSADPLMQFGRMKISDNERAILGQVAKINGWSRQATEGMYKMSVAMDRGMNSINDFLKNLTQIEPGYFNEFGGSALGLTESDRRSLMGIPDDYVEPANGLVEPFAPTDVASDTNMAAQNTVATAVAAMNKRLSPEEDTALSEAAQLNGVEKQSAVAYYKMYLAQHEQPSLSEFLALLVQNEPNSYGKDGVLNLKDDDDNRVICISI